MTIVNDEELGCYTIPLEFSSATGGFAVFDSIVFINRMADPTVFRLRVVNTDHVDGTSPDSLLLGATTAGMSLNSQNRKYAGDAVRLVNFIFKEGPPPCCP